MLEPLVPTESPEDKGNFLVRIHKTPPCVIGGGGVKVSTKKKGRVGFGNGHKTLYVKTVKIIFYVDCTRELCLFNYALHSVFTLNSPTSS